MRILKDKNARAMAATRRIPVELPPRIRSIKQRADQRFIAFKDTVRNKGRGILKIIGKILFFTLEDVKNIIGYLAKLFRAILDKIFAKLILVLIVSALLLGVYLFNSQFVEYVQANDLNSAREVLDHIGDLASVDEITSAGKRMVNYITHRIEGIDPTAQQEDDTKYGIFLKGIKTPVPRYHPGSEVTFSSRVEGSILKNFEDTTAHVYCFLEDADEPLSIEPGSEYRLDRLTKKIIICNFPGMSLSDTNVRDAQISVSYPFKALGHLDISVMDRELYSELYERFSHSSDVYDIIAEYAGLERAKQEAVSKNTPLQLNAYLDGNQPVMKGDKSTMSVVLTNRGEGTAYPEKLEILTPEGIELYEAAPIFHPEKTPEGYEIELEKLPLEADGIIDVYVGVQTQDFNTGGTYSNTKIEFELDYVYNVSREGKVRFHSCDDSIYENDDRCNGGKDEEDEPEEQPEERMGCCISDIGEDVVCEPRIQSECDVRQDERVTIRWREQGCDSIAYCG